MGAMTKGKNKKSSFSPYREERPADFVNLLYLFVIFGLYPLFIDVKNRYFNITATKAHFFLVSTLIYLMFILLAYGIEILLIRYYGSQDQIWKEPTVIFFRPVFWMALFLLANIMAWFMAEDKGKAWTGEDGRRFGLAMVLVIVCMFFFLARECRLKPWIFYVVFVSAIMAFFLSITQHFGWDFLKLRLGVAEKQKEMFISTFGNINTFASYICLALPVFLAVFIFSDRLSARITAGIGTVAGAMSIITAKSDNVYLGIFAAVLLLFYLSVLNKHIGRYAAALFLMSCGLCIMAVLNECLHGSTKHLNGFAAVVEDKRYMAALTVFLAVVSLILIVLRKKKPQLYQSFQSRRFLLIITLMLIAIAGVGIGIGVHSQNELFVFNDKWGTYRGYIWKRGFSLFQDAPLRNKLFGYGNETISHLMKEYYYDEMIAVTNRLYDNCHNEFLQYLVTTGLFGLISYLGLLITAFRYMWKRAQKDPFVIACLCGCAAYVAQSIVNLNQPITTPLYFVMLAAGVGAARSKEIEKFIVPLQKGQE